MNKKVWLEPKVSKLSVKDATRGSGPVPGDVCGGNSPVIDCSLP